jgi:hypothetical protein
MQDDQNKSAFSIDSGSVPRMQLSLLITALPLFLRKKKRKET